MTTYEYFINFDERGSFYADVRKPSGESVFEIKAEDEASIFEDGFMKHKTDLAGLTEYLQDLSILKQTDEIVLAN